MLKMDGAASCDTFVTIYQTTRHFIAEYSNLSVLINLCRYLFI
jgi:hypothetical protein